MVNVSSITNLLKSTSYFIFGFVTGTFIDLFFAMVYKRLAFAEKRYNSQVILVMIIHLLVLVGVLSWLLNLKHKQTEDHRIYTFMIHFGFVSSQFYLFDYISKYVGVLLMKYPDKFPERPVRDTKKAKKSVDHLTLES